ncbi:hypothetical protein NG791_26405 [Laspinema sp. D1]|uniref:hypothetical protein n=1 Tax=Laspinema palackyanum TaxID=3231601 RepID=UPI003493CB7A|nr:hypothetical protein [Laspinema sp. D2b]
MRESNVGDRLRHNCKDRIPRLDEGISEQARSTPGLDEGIVAPPEAPLARMKESPTGDSLRHSCAYRIPDLNEGIPNWR